MCGVLCLQKGDGRRGGERGREVRRVRVRAGGGEERREGDGGGREKEGWADEMIFPSLLPFETAMLQCRPVAMLQGSRRNK